MAVFTFRDDLLTLLRSNWVIQPDGSNYPKAIKDGDAPSVDTTAGTSLDAGIWTVFLPKYSDFPAGANLVDEQVVMRVTYYATPNITEANFFNAVEDVQQQFRENNTSPSRLYKIEMTGDIDEVTRTADMLVIMTKYVQDGTS